MSIYDQFFTSCYEPLIPYMQSPINRLTKSRLQHYFWVLLFSAFIISKSHVNADKVITDDVGINPQAQYFDASNTFCLLPFVVTDPESHTMGHSLYGYLDLKIHEFIRHRDFKNIWVIGDHCRYSGVSHFEKNDKLFNYQRPTAEIKGDDAYIRCYPGGDYVKHYASLIATYLALNGKNYSHVRYIIPDESICQNTLIHSNLTNLPYGEVAIVGYGLNVLADSNDNEWQGTGSFSWIERNVANTSLVFIGCRHSYWGDTAGRLVACLASRGFKKVIYVGKLGTLNAKMVPNETIATGDNSFVEGEIVKWKNFFEFAMNDHNIVFGKHYTCPSTIYETKEWLSLNHDYDFVDPEIGHMAKAAQAASIEFSYLHIVSDNLTSKFDEDLSNERSENIREKRLKLLLQIRSIIELNLKNRVSWQDA